MRSQVRIHRRVAAPLATLALVLAAACAPDDGPADEPAPDPTPDEQDDLDEPEPEEPAPDEDAAPDEPADDDAPDDEAPVEDDPDLSVALTLTDVASMNSPVAGAVGPDGVLHLAERAGTIHRFEDGELGPAVVDLSDETTTDGERGLLGLAFAEDGTELYVSYTDTGGDSVIEAFAVEEGQVQGDDRRTVLTLEQPYANHNGGDIQVGPDGYLYIGFGDGGAAGDPLEAGQDTGTWLGALLRIDASGDPYDVPSDNPFVDADGADEIWAYGLRNPWRFSFDRRTDDLWIADVGQNAREEINYMPAGEGAGANYGWNLMEGTLEFAGSAPEDHVPPVHEYDTGARCAITGGYVYRGEAIPELVGAYLFSDYCEALVRAIVVDGDGDVVDEAELGLQGQQHVSFAEDADGELYLLDFSGAVSRIDPA